MKDLLNRSLNGDSDSYTELIKLIQVELYKIAFSQLDNEDDINDALQETLINSYDKLHTLKNHDYFKTWIIRILINECNNIHRKRKRQLGLFRKVSDSMDSIPYSEVDIQNTENNIDFDLLIKHLNYDERLVVTLYYKNKYTSTEISNILNVSVNTVKSRLLRTKKKMKQLYEEGGLNNGRKK